ncbi:DNA distortion polypeptide 1, partial [Klebsiella quasipneumoniae]
LLASALLKSKDKKIEESIIDDNDDFIKTTLYLTATQRSKIEKASIRHGWTISRECRFRIQTTLDNNLDFYDQELLMLNRCRNVVDKIGRNFHYIIVNNQSMLLEKDDFYQDAQKLTFEMRSLKEQFENY